MQVQSDVVTQVEAVVQRGIGCLAYTGKEVIRVIDRSRQRAIGKHGVGFQEIVTALSWVIVVQQTHVVADLAGEAARVAGVIIDLDAVIEGNTGSPGANVETGFAHVVEATLNGRAAAGL